MTGIILAGGDSKRMGKNKALLDLCGKPLIEWVFENIKQVTDEVIIVTDKPHLYENIPAKKISDKISCEGKNPLVGIYSGLCVSNSRYNIAVACDMPFISISLARAMFEEANKGQHEVVVPHIDGHLEPLCAVYHRETRFLIEDWLKRGKFKIPDIYEHFKTKFLSEKFCLNYDPELYSFLNLNYPSDFDKAKEICKERAKKL
ncbi:molybdenum cofactor guanylyltransferase [Natranaerofaba carboxydovora]|uniref:molybdenum cofactor guanylyltransferase n=1 Tax=Natranaerofaba carboxydovora TaxID=2742683 RepID=UPI001F1343EF|nr:molybdenum cofactor guanylyltransferase [Natranaerofaba carboxydovora]UMZ72910.1 Molybdenum cofactor guanylyltransferase [Natranaerofaba carboxydovora]